MPPTKSLITLISTATKQVSAGTVEGPMAIIHAWQQHLRTKETEKTTRIKIEMETEIEITRIKEQSLILREYFSMAFNERATTIDHCFKLLDSGISNFDDKQIDFALSLITKLIEESPIKQAASIMHHISARKDSDIIDI